MSMLGARIRAEVQAMVGKAYVVRVREERIERSVPVRIVVELIPRRGA